MREPLEIRDSCAQKLRAVQASDHFRAILACLLDQNWTEPRLLDMILTPDGALLGWCEGQAGFSTFLGAQQDLIRNIHGVAKIAELDGDEIGYLVGKMAELKRQPS